MRIFSIKYTSSFDKIVNIRKNLNLKMCYRKKLSFLKYRISITNSLSNRLVIRSEFYRSYKNLCEYYVQFLRSNFAKTSELRESPYYIKLSQNKKYLSLYNKTTFATNLDFVLVWKAVQYNALFDIKTTAKKKKKKVTYIQRVTFIKPEKRILFVWKSLALLNRSLQVRDTPRRLSLIPTFENFLFTNNEGDIIHNYKLQIYKLHLLRAV